MKNGYIEHTLISLLIIDMSIKLDTIIINYPILMNKYNLITN